MRPRRSVNDRQKWPHFGSPLPALANNKREQGWKIRRDAAIVRASFVRGFSVSGPPPPPSPCDPSTSGSSMTLLTVSRAGLCSRAPPRLLYLLAVASILPRPSFLILSCSAEDLLSFRSITHFAPHYVGDVGSNCRMYVTLRCISGTFCLTNGPCPSPRRSITQRLKYGGSMYLRRV